MDLLKNQLTAKIDNLEENLIQNLSQIEISRNLPMPRQYSGKEDFGEYLAEWNKIADAHQWAPDRQLLIFPIYLTGEAKAIYDGLASVERDTWRHCSDAMAIRLKKLNTKENARRRLAELKQGPGESIMEFAQAIRSLVNKAHPDDSFINVPGESVAHREGRIREWKEELCKDHFRNGLNLKIKSKIAFMPAPATMLEAVTQAKAVEEAQNILSADANRVHQIEQWEEAIAKVNPVEAKFQELEQKMQADQVHEIQAQNNNTQQNFGNANYPRGQSYRRGNFSYHQWRGQNNSWQPRNQYNSGRGNYNRGNYGSNRGNFGNNRGRGRGNWNNNFRGNSNYVPLNQNRNFGDSQTLGYSSGSKPGVNAVHLPYLTLLALFCLFIPGVTSYQLCPRERIGVLANFPEAHECILPSSILSEKKNVTLFVPIRIPRNFPVYRCSARAVEVCTESVFRVVSQISSIKTQSITPTISECWKLVRDESLTRLGLHVWGTNNPQREEYNFVGMNCQTTFNSFLEKGEAGLLKGKVKSLWLSEYANWKIGEIIDKKMNTTYVWEIPSREYLFSHYPVGPVEAEILYSNRSARGLVKIDQFEYVFSPSANQTRETFVEGVPVEAWKMDNEVYVLVQGERRARRAIDDGDIYFEKSDQIPSTIQPILLHQNQRLKFTLRTDNYILPSTQAPTQPPTQATRKQNTRRTTTTESPSTVTTTPVPTKQAAILKVKPTKIIAPARRPAGRREEPERRPAGKREEGVIKIQGEQTTPTPSLILSSPETTTVLITTASTIATTTTMPIFTSSKAITTAVPASTMTSTTTTTTPSPISVTGAPKEVLSITPKTSKRIIVQKSLAPIPTIMTLSHTTISPIQKLPSVVTTPKSEKAFPTPKRGVVPPNLRRIKAEKLVQTTAVVPTPEPEEELDSLEPNSEHEKEVKEPDSVLEFDLEELKRQIKQDLLEELHHTRQRRQNNSGPKREEWVEQMARSNSVNHVNSRLNYLSHEKTQQIERSAREQWTATCQTRNRLLEVARVIARQNPTEAVRLLYARSDLTAFLEPGPEIVWRIASCAPVMVENIIWEQKLAEKCYEFLPVEVEGKILFLKPGSPDLLFESPQISCEKRPLRSNDSLASAFTQEHVFQSEPYQDPQTGKWFKRDSIFEDERVRLERDLKLFAASIANKPPIEMPTLTETKNLTTMLLNIFGHNITEYGRTALVKSVAQVTDIIEISKEKGTEMLEKTKEVVAEGWSILDKLKWSLIILGVGVGLMALVILTWKFRLIMSIIWMLLKVIPQLLALVFRCLKWGAQKDAEGAMEVAEVEMEIIPSAPPLDPIDVKPKFRNTYIPEIYAVRRNKKRCYVNVIMNGESHRALVDNGSDITFCSLTTAKNGGLIIERGNIPAARAANSTPLPFIGVAETKIEFGGISVPWKILVADDEMCPAGMILGTDFMEPHEEMSVNFKNQTIRLGNILLPMVAAIELDEEEKPIFVRVLSDQTLPPRSDSLIWGYIEEAIEPGKEFLAEEWHRHRYPALRVGKTLVKTTEQRAIPLRVLNYGYGPIELFARSRMATLEEIWEEKLKSNEINQIECFRSQPEYVSPEARWEENLPDISCEKSSEEKLSEKLNFNDTVLSPEGIQEVKRMVEVNGDAFVQADGLIGCYKGQTTHKIRMISGARPIQQRPYPIPHALRQEVEKQVKDMLKQEIIKPSASEWSSPIVLVRKADGKSWRFAVDYRAINKVTRRQTYLLPRIQDLIDVVGGKKLFSVFDLQAGFHQIKMEKASIDKTAFITHLGLYEFLRLPFGLAGAPHLFQQVMEEVRHRLSASFLVYLDDLILGSETEEEHLQDLGSFLKVMSEVGLKLKAEKCRWGCGEIRYLGFLLSEKGVRIDEKDLEPILKLERPKTLTELRSLIGMISYFRRFILGFADIMAPIYELTKKETIERWDEKHDNVLEEMKKRLTSAPVLAPPRLGRPFIVETDASLVAIGACLLQENESGEKHPIGFFSRGLGKHEKNYSVVELEALAVVAALKHFRVYLEGAGTSQVITDNSALTSLFRRRDLQGRLARYQVALQGFDVDIIYRPGKANQACDFFSRFPPTNTKIEVNAIKVKEKVTLPEMLEEQTKDDFCVKMKEKIENNILEEHEENFELWKGLVCRRIKDELKIYVPKSVITRIVEEYHADPTQGAHLGFSRTYEKIKRTLCWTGMARDIGNIVKECDICQRRKIVGKHMSREVLCPIEPAGRPFSRVHLDLLGPIQKSAHGHQYIWVCVDSFSKWVVATPLREQSAVTVAEAFTREVLCRFGTPEIVVTDMGTQFMSSTFHDLALTLKFKHSPTTAYHQRANGQVERFNRTLGDMLSSISQGKNWAELLPHVLFAYNTSWNNQIENTPFFILHGFHPRLPSESALELEGRDFTDMAIYVQELVENLEKARAKVKENLERNVDLMKEHQTKANPLVWNEGEWALLRKVGPRKKFGMRYDGPFRIKKVQTPNLILMQGDEREMEVHMDRCKPYYGKKIVEESDDVIQPTKEHTQRPLETLEDEYYDSDEDSLEGYGENLECLHELGGKKPEQWNWAREEPTSKNIQEVKLSEGEQIERCKENEWSGKVFENSNNQKRVESVLYGDMENDPYRVPYNNQPEEESEEEDESIWKGVNMNELKKWEPGPDTVYFWEMEKNTGEEPSIWDEVDLSELENWSPRRDTVWRWEEEMGNRSEAKKWDNREERRQTNLKWAEKCGRKQNKHNYFPFPSQSRMKRNNPALPVFPFKIPRKEHVPLSQQQEEARRQSQVDYNRAQREQAEEDQQYSPGRDNLWQQQQDNGAFDVEYVASNAVNTQVGEEHAKEGEEREETEEEDKEERLHVVEEEEQEETLSLGEEEIERWEELQKKCCELEEDSNEKEKGESRKRGDVPDVPDDHRENKEGDVEENTEAYERFKTWVEEHRVKDLLKKDEDKVLGKLKRTLEKQLKKQAKEEKKKNREKPREGNERREWAEELKDIENADFRRQKYLADLRFKDAKNKVEYVNNEIEKRRWELKRVENQEKNKTGFLSIIEKPPPFQRDACLCYNCGEIGHRSNSCTKPENRACRHCGVVGHIKKDCTQLGAQSSQSAIPLAHVQPAPDPFPWYNAVPPPPPPKEDPKVLIKALNNMNEQVQMANRKVEKMTEITQSSQEREKKNAERMLETLKIQKKLEEELAKLKSEKKKAEEEAQKAEEAKKAFEEAKKVEEAKKAEEEAKKVEEAKKAEEEAKKAEEEAKKAEDAKKAEETMTEKGGNEAEVEEEDDSWESKVKKLKEWEESMTHVFDRMAEDKKKAEEEKKLLEESVTKMELAGEEVKEKVNQAFKLLGEALELM